jgi:hypothetical protein
VLRADLYSENQIYIQSRPPDCKEKGIAQKMEGQNSLSVASDMSGKSVERIWQRSRQVNFGVPGPAHTSTLHCLRYSEAESQMVHIGEVMMRIPRFVAEDWLKSKFGPS